MRAEFCVPEAARLEQHGAEMAAELKAAAGLSAVDRLTLAMSSLQSELQLLLTCVHDWCAQVESEQQDVCWEVGLVHSITLSQAAKQLQQHHAQISIAYAPLIMQRNRARRGSEPSAASNREPASEPLPDVSSVDQVAAPPALHTQPPPSHCRLTAAASPLAGLPSRYAGAAQVPRRGPASASVSYADVSGASIDFDSDKGTRRPVRHRETPWGFWGGLNHLHSLR